MEQEAAKPQDVMPLHELDRHYTSETTPMTTPPAHLGVGAKQSDKGTH